MKRAIIGLLLGLVSGLGIGFVAGLASRSAVDAPAVEQKQADMARARASIERESDDHAPIGPEARPTRTRVRPPVPQVEAEPNPKPKPGPQGIVFHKGVPTSELLARIRATVAGEEGANVATVGSALAQRGEAGLLDLNSAVVLLRDGSQWSWVTVQAVISSWPGDRLLELLRIGLATDDPADRVARMAPYAAQHLVGSAVTVPPALVDQLLAREDEFRRGAGLRLAYALDEIPIDTLERIAMSDADQYTRAQALRVVADRLLNSAPHPLRRRATDLVLRALDDESSEVRRVAIDHMPGLGSSAVDAALRFTRDEGMTTDERFAALETIAEAGRLADFFASAPSDRRVQELGAVVTELDEDGDAIKLALPYVQRLLPMLDDEIAGELVWKIHAIATTDFFVQIARQTDAPHDARGVALFVLLDRTDDADSSVDARRRVGADLLLELTDPSRAPPGLRRHIIDEVASSFFDDDDDPISPTIERAVRRAAATDPNVWVRNAAAELVRNMDE